MLNTPILFLVFNRPDCTRLVLNEIKKIKPQKLYIAADGPRENNLSDILICLEAKKNIDRLTYWNFPIYNFSFITCPEVAINY